MATEIETNLAKLSGVECRTDGRGYWSGAAKPVRITRAVIVGDIELRVYFDTATWDVEVDNLIYTDQGFVTALHQAMERCCGMTHEQASDFYYSEQGMQGDDYVSFDIGPTFLGR